MEKYEFKLRDPQEIIRAAKDVADSFGVDETDLKPEEVSALKKLRKALGM